MRSTSTETALKSLGSEQDPGTTIRNAYAGRLMPEHLVRVFAGAIPAFPTRTIACGRKALPLPREERRFDDLVIESRDERYDLYDYLSRNRVAGLLIVKDGRILLEYYGLGIDAGTRWTSMSIAKSVSTTLVGAAIQDGRIGSVEDALTDYLPTLRGSAYDGVSIRHVLQMTSGVRWDDTHTDPASDRRRMLDLQVAQKPGSIIDYVGGRPRVATAGSAWNYSTGETHVIGALVRAAVGKWLSDYLSERIWAPFGMEADATWWLEAPDGLEVAGSGIHATLRDYARFGLFMMNDGCVDDRRVVPEGWVCEATAPRQIAGAQLDYGYMWWPVPATNGRCDGRAFSARGIFGQYLYVHPGERVVIAVLSARSKPKNAEVILDNDFFNAAVEVLR
jgi:CubicO group peptidase (beta-lactamase class C family)